MTKLFDLSAQNGDIHEIIIRQVQMPFACKTRSIWQKKKEYQGFTFKIKYNSTVE